MTALKKNNTWKLIDKPKDQKTVSCKWIFKKNDGIPRVQKTRYKAKLVAKGFSQRDTTKKNDGDSKRTAIPGFFFFYCDYNCEKIVVPLSFDKES